MKDKAGHRRSRDRRRWLAIAFMPLLIALGARREAIAFPIHGDQTVLPSGSDLNEDAFDVPNELFDSEETGGKKSYLINLGDMAFNAPSLLGGVARRAGMSCGTCHVNGASNAKLYMPGMSTRPGNFDTTGPLFNPKANNGVLDPLTIPSLRGARYLAPYGHNGRFASLRDFIRNVVVNEFAGPKPSSAILDAMVAYIQDIDFLPNPRLTADGRLTAKASAAEKRGEALFEKPFRHDPGLSCAACHIPSGAFVDHRQHDVGTGGLFKTATLINANYNAPYFHDGRFDTYDQVVAYFNSFYDLGLSGEDRKDLIAYLKAVGDGKDGMQPDSIDAQLKEISDFSSVFAVAIPDHNMPVIDLAVDTIGGELRELTDRFPDRKDTTVEGGKEERGRARLALKEMVLTLRRIDLAASGGTFDIAAAAYGDYGKELNQVGPLLKAAESWSLFNPAIHDAHYAAMRQILRTATGDETPASSP